LGYAFKSNDKTRLEAYTRFSWLRQESDSVRVLGDKVRFSAIDSQRLRGGLRYVYSASESFTPYVGIAYEHEFDGQSKAKTLGDKIDAPDLKGGTTIAELGFTYRATKTSPFSASFGIQSYAGKREGGGGSFRLDYRF
jgi:outer membrane autotransporter protein